MTKAEAVARLRAREGEIRALGIERLSIFGSTARGDECVDSDADLAATINYDAVRKLGPFGFFEIGGQIATLLGARVDLVTEPARKGRVQAEIDRDRVLVF